MLPSSVLPPFETNASSHRAILWQNRQAFTCDTGKDAVRKLSKTQEGHALDISSMQTHPHLLGAVAPVRILLVAGSLHLENNGRNMTDIFLITSGSALGRCEASGSRPGISSTIGAFRE